MNLSTNAVTTGGTDSVRIDNYTKTTFSTSKISLLRATTEIICNVAKIDMAYFREVFLLWRDVVRMGWTDSVWTEHQRWSPQCMFAKMTGPPETLSQEPPLTCQGPPKPSYSIHRKKSTVPRYPGTTQFPDNFESMPCLSDCHLYGRGNLFVMCTQCPKRRRAAAQGEYVIFR